MSDTRTTHDSEQAVERLLKAAGPRTQPPEALRERVHSQVVAAWEALPESSSQTVDEPDVQKTHSRFRMLAVAATFAAAAFAGALYFTSQPATVSPVGEIVQATGAYTVRGSGSANSPYVAPGALVGTSDEGRLLIRLNATTSVRFDTATRATLHDTSEIWLHSGRIYIDSTDNKANSVNVVTDSGATITDIGTLFEVAVEGDLLSVAVREGGVNIDLGGAKETAYAKDGQGDVLEISSGFVVENRYQVGTTSEHWNWTTHTQPEFDQKNASYYDYFEWLARQTGRELSMERIVEQRLRIDRPKGSASLADLPLNAILESSDTQLIEGEPYKLIVDFR